MSSLREIITKCNDKFLNWILYRPLRREKNALKRFEKKVWMELSGAFLGGMAAATSWVKYKSYYYDKISFEDEKLLVKTTLLSMLKSDRYDISQKAIISYVCADLEIKAALQDIRVLMQYAHEDSDQRKYRLACDALTKGIPVDRLVEQKIQNK